MEKEIIHVDMDAFYAAVTFKMDLIIRRKIFCLALCPDPQDLLFTESEKSKKTM